MVSVLLSVLRREDRARGVAGRGYAWFDIGTMDSLYGAGEFVQAVRHAQGLPIAVAEEIAFENGCIGRNSLYEAACKYGKS
jgi:glucose-1-phosphate thymidylyltransferase